MFSPDIRQIQLSLKPCSSMNSEESTSSEFDLQYELYSKYLHIAKQQIGVNELLLIADSSSLVQSVAANRKVDLSRDVSSTMDSFSYDEDFSPSALEDISVIQRASSKKITRKGVRRSTLRTSGSANDCVSDVLEEVERNCSQKAYQTLQNLLREHQKNASRVADIEKKQRLQKKSQENLEKAEQSNLLLNAKVKELSSQIAAKEEEVKSLRQKLEKLKNESSSTSQSSQSVFEEKAPSARYQQLVAYLNQKQSCLNARAISIRKVESDFEQKIEDSILTQNQYRQCGQNCCHIIRKIKESVRKYREYLEEEAEHCERLYLFAKDQLLSGRVNYTTE